MALAKCTASPYDLKTWFNGLSQCFKSSKNDRASANYLGFLNRRHRLPDHFLVGTGFLSKRAFFPSPLMHPLVSVSACVQHDRSRLSRTPCTFSVPRKMLMGIVLMGGVWMWVSWLDLRRGG